MSEDNDECRLKKLRLKQIIETVSRDTEEVSFQKIFMALNKSRNSAFILYNRMVEMQLNKYYRFYKQYMKFRVNNLELDRIMRWVIDAQDYLNELKEYCEQNPDVLQTGKKSIFKRK